MSSPDWAVIERDYRAGMKTLRVIGEEQGVSHPLIVKRARQNGWSRDLRQQIKAKADELVARVVAEPDASDVEIVETNAEIVKQVRISHRKDIGRIRAIVAGLVAELEAFDKSPDTLSGRVKVVKELTDATKSLVAMEREAYSIDSAPEERPVDTPDLLDTARRIAFLFAAGTMVH